MLGLTSLAGGSPQTPSDVFAARNVGHSDFGAAWRAGLERVILASMATYEYRVTEAADGTFPVELWSSQGDRSQLI